MTLCKGGTAAGGNLSNESAYLTRQLCMYISTPAIVFLESLSSINN